MSAESDDGDLADDGAHVLVADCADDAAGEAAGLDEAAGGPAHDGHLELLLPPGTPPLFHPLPATGEGTPVRLEGEELPGLQARQLQLLPPLHLRLDRVRRHPFGADA